MKDVSEIHREICGYLLPILTCVSSRCSVNKYKYQVGCLKNIGEWDLQVDFTFHDGCVGKYQ